MSAQETWRLRPDEFASLKCLAAADYLVTGDPKTLPALNRRIDAVLGLREQIDALGRLLDDVCMRLTLTVPTEQRASVLRQMTWSELRVGVPQVVDDAGCMVISLRDLGYLVDAARATECWFCPKTEAQARACPLRKTLDAISAHNYPRIAGCSYREGTVDEPKVPWERPPEKESKSEAIR